MSMEQNNRNVWGDKQKYIKKKVEREDKKVRQIDRQIKRERESKSVRVRDSQKERKY